MQLVGDFLDSVVALLAHVVKARSDPVGGFANRFVTENGILILQQLDIVGDIHELIHRRGLPHQELECHCLEFDVATHFGEGEKAVDELTLERAPEAGGDDGALNEVVYTVNSCRIPEYFIGPAFLFVALLVSRYDSAAS